MFQEPHSLPLFPQFAYVVKLNSFMCYVSTAYVGYMHSKPLDVSVNNHGLTMDLASLMFKVSSFVIYSNTTNT